MTYLDYNATTPVDNRVIECMNDVYINHPGNAGSRTHLMGDDCRRIVEEARGQIANLAGVDSTGIVFTSGATESDNIALRGLREYGKSTGRVHVLVSSIEHKAVLNASKALEEDGFEIEQIPVNESGAISVDDAIKRIRKDTLIISVMHVNNETGVIQPVKELGEVIASEYPKTFFHIDAAQSFGKLINEVKDLSYDMMSITAHKVYGPQGIGALILRHKKYVLPPLKPLLFGGGQERGLRSGTQPVALIAGFGKAAELCTKDWKKDLKLETAIKDNFLSALKKSGVRHQVNGQIDLCVPTCLNVSFEDVSSEALMISTRQRVSVSNGSACTSSSYEPSYVLTAMGLGTERAESAIRISWGRMSKLHESIDAFNTLIRSARMLQGD